INAKNISKYNIILCDEVHLFPKDGEGQYQTLLKRLKELNSKIKLIGFTATPFRMLSGLLTEGDDCIFTDIVYEVGIETLIERKYLCNLRSKISEINVDLNGVGKSGGDYVTSQLEEAMTSDIKKVEKTIKEIIKYAGDRKSWIIFCTGLQHVDLVCRFLTESGIGNQSITGVTPKDERDQYIDDFKNGKIRCLVNCNVLTTGFNAPNIDLLVMLRPTQSPGLYTQMVGRGSRLSEGKEDCLVL
ncbi:unnamed protein product, partial [marine sediment metagenome]